MTKILKNIFPLIAILLIGAVKLDASVIEIFDVQTGLTGARGEFYFRATAYDNGGLGVKAGMGVTEWLSLGITEFVDGLIGNGTNRWEIPGVFGKINVTSLPPESINLAFGYAPLYHGTFTEGTNRPYGIFLTATKGFFLLAPLPHLFTLNVAYPVVPNLGKFTVSTSLLVEFTQMFSYGFELTDLTFNPESKYDFINNHVVAMAISENFSLQFIFQLAGKIHTNADKTSKLDIENSRNLRINFSAYF
jgi:hypothetical protein